MKFINLLKKEFMSTPYETEEFREFVSAFKSDIKKIFKPYMKKIEFNKGHFYICGFVQLLDNRIWYFSIGDIRCWKGTMLIRTAEHFKDWTGGSNGFIPVDENFKTNLLNHLRVDRLKEVE